MTQCSLRKEDYLDAEEKEGVALTESADYLEFVNHATKHVLARLSGTESSRRPGDKPSRSGVCVGTILPRMKDGMKRAGSRHATPTEVGLEVLCDRERIANSLVEVEFEASFFYRVFPTLDEQRHGHYQIVESEEEEEEVNGSISEVAVAEDILRRIYKKSGPHKVSVRLRLSDVIECGKKGLDIADVAEIATNALSEYSTDEKKFRSRKFASRKLADRQNELRIPAEKLSDDETFSRYLDEAFSGASQAPLWTAGAKAILSHYDDGRMRLRVTLQNRAEEKKYMEDVDNAMFGASVRIRPIGFEFDKFVLVEIEEHRRYDNTVEGLGINCIAQAESSGGWIRTVHAPISIQYRYNAKVFEEADMNELSESPIRYLAELKRLMEEHLDNMKNADDISDLTDIGKYYHQQDVRRFERELARFTAGLKALEELPEVLEAFKLTNRSFSSSSKGFTNWYRYQIVFLICLIPDLVSVRHPECENCRGDVDVIYFPTGGGKTETYLAAVVFQMFYDRLCGKRQGVSAITKFPLRLLSLQQIQRIADVFGAAEKIRRAHSAIGLPEYSSFSTGYYVGEKNTPNKLFKPRMYGNEVTDEITPVIRGDEKCRGYKIITRCPFCGESSIELDGDLANARVKLICSSCKETIPVYVSDDEVYRFLPTFIVSTLDKMAISGLSSRFKNIYGESSRRCPDHGFISGGKCLYSGKGNLCSRTADEYESVVLEDPTPSLLIQDEMHLVRESLGSYDAHYETFLDSLQMELTSESKRMKVIAATATISHFEDQIRHLYARKGSLFPSSGGRSPAESFYAGEDRMTPARITIGVLPHARTMIHCVLDIISSYYELTRIRERSGDDLMEKYRLMLSYNLKKMQGDAVSYSVSSMVNERLRDSGLQEIRSESLTGEVTFADIRRVLEAVENPSSGSGIDLITATSMISHGVDIDVMNFMVFQGMPSSTAEYLQAQSRVGRKHPGIVFVVFDHNRERDVSHYRYFLPYHNLRELMIEPVPINRWAKFSINQTLPGIFCGSILNCFEALVQRQGVRRLYMTNDFKSAMNAGVISEDGILDFLMKSYRVREEDIGYVFEDYIRTVAKRYIGELLASPHNVYLTNAISDRPLTNLRDVDVQVEISKSAESFEPMERLGSRYAAEDDT